MRKTGFEGIIPNPNTASPSDKYLENFKDHFKNYSDDSLTAFEDLF